MSDNTADTNVLPDAHPQSTINIDDGNIGDIVEQMTRAQLDPGSKQSVEKDEKEDEQTPTQTDDDESTSTEHDQSTDESDQDDQVEDDQETDEQTSDNDEDDDLFDEQSSDDDTDSTTDSDIVLDDNYNIELSDDVSVTFGDLKDGYMRTQDYTTKTQELTKQRESVTQFQELALAQLGGEINRYETALEQLNAVDLVSLQKTDPAKYQQTDALIKEVSKRLSTERDKLEQFGQQYQQTKQTMMQERLEKGVPVLREYLPDWSPQTAQDITEHLKQAGVSEQGMIELSQITDPTVYIALHKAMRFDRAKAKSEAKRAKTKKNVVSKPTKTLKAKSTQDVKTVVSKKRKQTLNAIQTSSNPEDIARMITETMVGGQ